MKKIITTMVLLSGMVAYAQETNGKVGVNTETPKATLDVQPSTTNLTGTTNEGLLIPRLSKERVAKMASPETSTLVYVDEATTYTTGTDTAADTRVENIDAVGFYHYNGTQWVKHLDTDTNDAEWVYDATTNRINLKRSGNNTFTNKVYYDTEAGRHINVDATSVMREANVSGADITSDLTTEGSSFNVSHLKADKIVYNYSNPLFYYASKDESFLQVNDAAISKPNQQKHFANSINYTYTDASTTQNLGSLLGVFGRAVHRGTGTISNNVAGIGGAAYAKGGGVFRLVGVTATGAIHTSSKIVNAEGLLGTVNIGRGNLSVDITNATSLHAINTIYGGGNIESLSGTLINNAISTLGASINIGNVYGVKYLGLTGSINILTGTIGNHYGIYLENIEKGSKNYSIYTNAGQVRFGDLAGTGNREVYVDENGVLKAKTTTMASNTTLWVEDVATNSIKLAVNSDGNTRTNAVSITDGGMVLGSSFRGTNGATIFPDYVFQKYYTGNSSIKADYTFKTLSQVEDFVKTNGHLPGYKSAEAIKAQGYVDLMETQLTNVEKIEELYLHSIEQEKNLKELKNQNDELKAKNQELETRLEKLEKLLK